MGTLRHDRREAVMSEKNKLGSTASIRRARVGVLRKSETTASKTFGDTALAVVAKTVLKWQDSPSRGAPQVRNHVEEAGCDPGILRRFDLTPAVAETAEAALRTPGAWPAATNLFGQNNDRKR